MPEKTSLLAETPESLAAFLAAGGQPAYRAAQILSWVWKKRAASWDAMTNLPKNLRALLADRFSLNPTDLLLEKKSADVTGKLLLRLHDGALVETVLIRAPRDDAPAAGDRLTLCVSTQVGCAMGCKFCASGLDGLRRDLDASEILAQVHHAARLVENDTPPALRDDRLPFDNLVVMGMGEPLANYDATLAALRVLNAPWGPAFGARRVTLSTSGLAPQILRLADDSLPVRLAVSLHAATDDVRSQIMPVNKAYPLAKLLPAIKTFASKKGRMVTLEYILIENLNDSTRQAAALAEIARDLHAHVNLIPYNEVDGLAWKRPPPEIQNAFLDTLLDARVSATLRREKGADINAACGQLRLKTERPPPPAA
ncbi:MAG: 23S rRNA (adenine(2503)-C(2))-methyltransferase RlmN [Opitutaceae bacterium]|jgi:23S rRNA (adenine2503-C2)-methyltransferase|nr:23S rRNA (adenine(2503)-C(2))-methyltransferase RlmN [Opitutaceae bacterium]